MKLVYIAGPYTGADFLEVDRNIARAREAAAFVASHGLGFFCPHLNSAHFENITPSVPAAFWYELDLKLLEACDAILLLPGWSESKGSMAEARHASRAGKPVFEYEHQAGGIERLLRWGEEVPA